MAKLIMDAAGLLVQDMATSVAFYRDVLGMTTDWNGDANAELYSGKMRLILYGRADFECMTHRAYSYVQGVSGATELSFTLPCFADVDVEYARVTAAGATPILPPTDEPWGQRTSYVADPDGNLIELSSFGKGETT